MSVSVHLSDCVAWLAEQAERIARGEAAAFDACVTDPPYHLTSIVKRFSGAKAESHLSVAAGKDLSKIKSPQYKRLSKGFMGKQWDGGDIAFRPETWRAVYDCMKPGAHLIAFSGTRTYHRMACAIEDAGFEICDQLKFDHSLAPLWDGLWDSLDPWQAETLARLLDGMSMEGQLAWCYGSGFPKSHDVSKATDKAAAWQGWGTALKPAWEPICLARKPISESSIAANVLAHGTGALNIDGCRIDAAGRPMIESRSDASVNTFGNGLNGFRAAGKTNLGRWPANICHDGSDEVLAGFPSETGKAGSGSGSGGIWSVSTGKPAGPQHGDSGSAARFFYSAKAGPLDRLGSDHPTVKRVDLMCWLLRMVTPPGGRVLDPFAGSGTTGIAAMAEGFDATLIDIEPDHVRDIERKIALLRGEAAGLFDQHVNRRAAPKGPEDLPMFGGAAA